MQSLLLCHVNLGGIVHAKMLVKPKLAILGGFWGFFNDAIKDRERLQNLKSYVLLNVEFIQLPPFLSSSNWSRRKTFEGLMIRREA